MPQSYSLLQKTLAWSVHAFTASGLIAGLLALVEINENNPRGAMFWLIVALVIDGIDGTFARLFRVREVLPKMDGKTIDYIVDFFTYAIIPAYWIYYSDLITLEWRLPMAALILLISALYYGREGMVTEDMHFLGFPVLWNMVVFYLVFVFGFPNWGNIVAIIFFAILHFVPIKFTYPSQTMRFKWATLTVTIIFIINLLLLVFYYPEQPFILYLLAIGTALYYGILGVYETWFVK